MASSSTPEPETDPRIDAPPDGRAVSDSLRRACILIVDDDPALARVVTRILTRAGFERVHAELDSTVALRRFEELGPDLVLLDLHMPEVGGFRLLEAIDDRRSPDEFLPVLVLTGSIEPEVRQEALSRGANDFVAKPFDPAELVSRTRNLLETRRLQETLRSFNATLTREVRKRTSELVDAKLEILGRLVRAAEYRDDVTGRHASRVGHLTARLGRAVGLPDGDVDTLALAAPLHDIGKIGIPDAILRKCGPLDDDERRTMEEHTRIGSNILSGSSFDVLETAEEIALRHHERWDGTGYPDGLGGSDIPLSGRIVAVADAFDCMTHARPYRRAQSEREALREVLACAGTHFDPVVARALVELGNAGELAPIDGAASTRRTDGVSAGSSALGARRAGRRRSGNAPAEGWIAGLHGRPTPTGPPAPPVRTPFVPALARPRRTPA